MAERANHILICFHDFNRGGTERIALGMARRWLDQGRQVTILCGARTGGLEDTVDPRIEVVELDPPLPRSLTSRLRLGPAMAPYVERLRPDVIFLPGNFHFPLIPALAKARGRAALVVKISNPVLPEGAAARPMRWLLRHFVRDLDGFAAMNTGLEAEIRAIAPWVNVSTLYDPVFLAENPAPHRPAGDRLEILWAGRFEPQKDVPLALNTIAALNRITPARLTMLGEGYLRPRMEKMASGMGLGDAVRFMGHVPAIDPFLADADALFVSSTFEGGPAVAVEALAHGVPVVSTDCSHFLRDIMTIPEAGMIVPSRKAELLAHGLLAVAQAPRPTPALLRPLIAHLAADPCADAYLAWFDHVVHDRAASMGN
ncbi:glycosyltransferase [Novosphingobium sediminicola]|uniref:Glycosyltransferase involved in cell wall biosynthesis n=1 Tax=Novosphingobium sediminicola TaxID=563162 RepID=A0A7W6G7A5_9SPHN|nr:glycosyltransferase [Novosphingobium sediminicola]MBB3954762.1 glycosyltransferase involved in cell wall biosynthesis [Novosphingobium sediminicola]